MQINVFYCILSCEDKIEIYIVVATCNKYIFCLIYLVVCLLHCVCTHVYALKLHMSVEAVEVCGC